MNNKFIKAEHIPLKDHPELNEKWVQNLIADDPSILGLGDVRSVQSTQATSVNHE